MSANGSQTNYRMMTGLSPNPSRSQYQALANQEARTITSQSNQITAQNRLWTPWRKKKDRRAKDFYYFAMRPQLKPNQTHGHESNSATVHSDKAMLDIAKAVRTQLTLNNGLQLASPGSSVQTQPSGPPPAQQPLPRSKKLTSRRKAGSRKYMKSCARIETFLSEMQELRAAEPITNDAGDIVMAEESSQVRNILPNQLTLVDRPKWQKPLD